MTVHVNVNAGIRVNAYAVISRAVEEGVAYGYMRAHKHVDSPTEAHLTSEVTDAVMGALCGVLDFDAQTDTPDLETPVPSPTTPDFLATCLVNLAGRTYGPAKTATDCVRATLAILEAAHGPLSATERKDILISHGDRTRPWSPIEAVAAKLGGASGARPELPMPGRWHLFQGWRVLDGGTRIPDVAILGPNGHAGFFWYEGATGAVFVVNANVGTKPWAYWGLLHDLESPYAAGFQWAVLPEAA
jgi:hypothetical protein